MKWLVLIMSLVLAILCEALIALAYEPNVLVYVVRAMFSVLLVFAWLAAIEGKRP
ncbi:MAG: hypothetical protein AAFN66_10780 [Pseudomonadota bacterium]